MRRIGLMVNLAPRKHALVAVALLLGETPMERRGHPKLMIFLGQMEDIPYFEVVSLLVYND